MRGAKIMGIAVGSYSKDVSSLKPLLALALDEILNSCSSQSNLGTLRKLYKGANKAPWPSLRITEAEKQIWRWCSDRGYGKNNLSSCIELKFGTVPMFVEIDRTLLEEEVAPVSLLRLYEVFKANLMKIFAGLLQEKRILIFSQEKPCWLISGMACAVARLVSPPIPYIAQLHLYPFVNLNNLDFLGTSFFIAGANNPLFKLRTQWWDVMADLDTGEVISSVPVGRFHKEFIENLEAILANDDQKEMRIRSHFFDYTQHIMDSMMFEEEFEALECKIGTQEKCGSLALQYYEIQRGKLGSFQEGGALRVNLLRLRLSHMKGIVAGVHEIYRNLYKGLKEKKDCIELLAMMPNSGDLHCIAWGFFTENTNAWKYACKILSKIEEISEGKFLVTTLPTSELNAYLAYKHRY